MPSRNRIWRAATSVLKCNLGIHAWHGCGCKICGKIRDQDHDWAGCKCKNYLCCKVRDRDHEWTHCRCKSCAKIRDQDHRWDGCKCGLCGKIQDQDHRWSEVREECLRCGKAPTEADEQKAATKEAAEAFHDAARNGDLEKVRAMLKGNPDLVFSRDSLYASWSPLHDAAHGARRDVAELLLANRADVNRKDKDGQTSLHWAVGRGHKDTAELLLAHGADVNAKDNDGKTPLSRAVYAGHRDVAELLLVNGAEVNTKNANSETPLHDAVDKNLPDVTRLLLAHGADVNAKGKWGNSPLHNAASGDCKGVAEVLLANKADVNARDNDGSTPLHWAARSATKSGWRNVAELLLANGADAYAQNDSGRTPLQHAAHFIPTDIMERNHAMSWNDEMSRAFGKRQFLPLSDPERREAERVSNARAVASNYDDFRLLLERWPLFKPIDSFARGPEAQSRKPCPVCGTSMREEGAPLTLSCSDGHDRLSFFSFDNSYATLSTTVASLLAKRGYQVVKSGEGDHYNIIGQAAPASPIPPNTLALAAQSKDPKDSIPWDYIGKVPADNRAFFELHKAALPDIFAKVRGMGSDPILILVAFEQEKWRALLALLYKRPQNMLFTPESYLGTKPIILNNGYCWVYVPPTVNGNPMQSAVFAVERDWLASELCLIKGMERMFIDEIRDKQFRADGIFTIAVFAAGGMFVEHLPG
jgi:ankyrin repeat protein